MRYLLFAVLLVGCGSKVDKKAALKEKHYKTLIALDVYSKQLIDRYSAGGDANEIRVLRAMYDSAHRVSDSLNAVLSASVSASSTH